MHRELFLNLPDVISATLSASWSVPKLSDAFSITGFVGCLLRAEKIYHNFSINVPAKQSE